jgi:sulfate transport system permease protein
MAARVLPGFGLTLGTSLLYFSLMTFVPLAALMYKASQLAWSDFIGYVTDPRALATYRVTLTAAGLAAVFNLVLGLGVAWILERYEFHGRRLLDAAVDLAFALPTAVAGLSLAALTGPQGPVGRLFGLWDIPIAYAFPGLVVAMTFTSFPFVVRTVQPVIADLDHAVEECAQSLGARPFTTFRRVILPVLLPSLISGTAVAFVRSLGEFGAIVFISGNLPFRTEVSSMLIFIRMNEFDTPGAAALATVILLFALGVLVVSNVCQALLNRRMGGQQ